MTTANQICTVCDHDYDNEEKKPLVLACGHSFCKDCFLKMENTGNRQCPVCRSDWGHRDVDSLPVCYQLLPEPGSNDPFRCELHNNHMTIWCTSCEVRCCLICLHKNHQGCSWKPVQTEIDELQGKIEEIQMRAKQSISKNNEKIRASRETASRDLQTVKKLKIAISQVENSLEDQLTRLNVIEMEMLHSTVKLTATIGPAGQDLLLHLKDKVSSLQELQLNEIDWRFSSIPVDMASVILWYRGQGSGDSGMTVQEAQEIVHRDLTEVVSEDEDNDGSSAPTWMTSNPAPTEGSAKGTDASSPTLISTLDSEVETWHLLNFMSSF